LSLHDALPIYVFLPFWAITNLEITFDTNDALDRLGISPRLRYRTRSQVKLAGARSRRAGNGRLRKTATGSGRGHERRQTTAEQALHDVRMTNRGCRLIGTIIRKGGGAALHFFK